ncbi:hypothetical protein K9M74_02185 [Candidatus Woesearchaeota archaeon]|nr:hypothetical protein [Candidatus Woesearchaeota archaeon]
MKRKTKIIIMLLFCLLVTPVIAQNAQTLIVKNETISFTLLQNHACGLEENLFRIDRLNYSVGIERLAFTYTQETRTQDNLLSKIDVHKNLNLYTATKTSFSQITTNQTYTIGIEYQNQTLWWSIQGNCSPILAENNSLESTSNNTSINNTTIANNTEDNLTNTLNTTLKNDSANTTNITNNTSTNNININNTIEKNNSTNTTSTTNITNNIQLNNTEENKTTTEQNLSQNSSANCFEYAHIYTDKDIYAVGEKMNMQFYISPLSESFSITYEIKDLYGQSIKKNYTTNNLHTKTHTWKSIDAQERVYFIYAVFEDECSIQKEEKIIVVQNRNYEEPIIDETINLYELNEEFIENITISTITLQEDEAIVLLTLQRGNSRKTTVTCKYTDQQNRRIQDDSKIKLLTKNQKISTTLHLSAKSEKGILFCEGLGVTATAEILFPPQETTIDKQEETASNQTTTQTNKQQTNEVNVSSLLLPKITPIQNDSNELTGFAIVSNTTRQQKQTMHIILIGLCILSLTSILSYKLFTARKTRIEQDQ